VMPHFTTWDSRRFDFQGTEASAGNETGIFKSPGSDCIITWRSSCSDPS